MDTTRHSEFRELLLGEREQATKQISALDHNLSSIDDATQFTSTDDEHDPEGVTIAFERSQARYSNHLALTWPKWPQPWSESCGAATDSAKNAVPPSPTIDSSLAPPHVPASPAPRDEKQN